MKLSTNFGFMAVMLVALSLFSVKPARAAISCNAIPGGTAWPYGFTQYCGSASESAGTAAANTLQAILVQDQPSGVAENEAGDILKNFRTPKVSITAKKAAILDAERFGARFWVFGTDAEFYSFCETTPNYEMFGLTSAGQCTDDELVADTDGSTMPGAYTLIFTQSIAAVKGQTVEHITAHEAGHWLDASPQYRTLLLSTLSHASDGTGFQRELNQDWRVFNLNEGCGLNGIFVTLQDESGQFICTGSGAGTGTDSGPGTGLEPPYGGTNKNVLQRAWGYFFNRNDSPEKIVFGGSATAGNTVTVVVTDPTLVVPVTQAAFSVPSDSIPLHDIATGLEVALNQAFQTNTGAGGEKYIATIEGTTLYITNSSQGTVSYVIKETSAGNTSFTLKLTVDDAAYVNGRYSSATTSSELFAEAFALRAGYVLGGYQSPDAYYRNGEFDCILTLVEGIATNGKIPANPGELGYVWPEACALAWP